MTSAYSYEISNIIYLDLVHILLSDEINCRLDVYLAWILYIVILLLIRCIILHNSSKQHHKRTLSLHLVYTCDLGIFEHLVDTFCTYVHLLDLYDRRIFLIAHRFYKIFSSVAMKSNPHVTPWIIIVSPVSSLLTRSDDKRLSRSQFISLPRNCKCTLALLYHMDNI